MNKTDKIEYKVEGARRMQIRKENRLAKFKTKIQRRYHGDPDYSCPSCGLASEYCHTDPDNEWGYKCSNCGTTFETLET